MPYFNGYRVQFYNTETKEIVIIGYHRASIAKDTVKQMNISGGIIQADYIGVERFEYKRGGEKNAWKKNYTENNTCN